MDAAMAECSQRSLSGPEADGAWRHFRLALRWWPSNASALVSLAHLQRDTGRLLEALRLYAKAASLPCAERPRGHGDGWAEAWIHEPRRSCQPFATAMQALLLSMAGDHGAAVAPLRRLGFRFRIAPSVWDRVRDPSPVPSTAADPPVRLVSGAIPPALHQRLREAFAPGAAYWRETDYDRRGYFSFWYPVAEDPTCGRSCH